MKKCSDYVLMAKEARGNRRMSDREFGAGAGLSSSSISDARYGKMSDTVALYVASLVPGLDAGEVLMAARLERESNPIIAKALNAWAKKALGRASQVTAAALAGVAVVLGLLQPVDLRMATGGEGGIRTHGSLRYA